VAIYKDKMLVRKCKYKLQNCCSNSQVEQIAILKTLEKLPTIAIQNSGRVAIYTDRKVTLASVRDNSTHSFLIEEMRNQLRHLMMQDWSIHFGWVKAHTGFEGNKVADNLAKKQPRTLMNETYYMIGY